MSESTHLKCPCQHCGSSIEFPSHGVGLTIDCPHCAGKTVLFIPAAGSLENAEHAPDSGALASEIEGRSSPENEGQSSGRRGSRILWVVVGVVLAAGVGGFIALRTKPAESESRTASALTLSNSHSVLPTSSALPPSETNVTASTKVAKSVDDLKVGPIKLEKAKGSSLVYAVGVMRNASNLQRFGVTIELELTDAGGRKVGTAKDYRNVIEPRQEWRFRALVLDSKAVSASVAQIREEEIRRAHVWSLRHL